MKHIKLLLIAFFGVLTFGYGQCLTDNFNSGYGNWSDNGTYQNTTAGLTGDGTGFNTNGDEIITSSILTNPQTLTLWLARSSSTANKTLSVQYSTTNTGPWTSARDILVGEVTTTHQEFTVNLNLTGDYFLRIAMTQRTGGSYYLDDVEVTCSTSTTSVEFVSTTSTLAENGIFIDVCVAISNEDATNATTVEIALDGASTATNGTDYDDGAGTPAAITFPQTLTFPAGSNANQCLTIYISNDDAVYETSEDVILNLQNASGGNAAALGTNTQHTLTITDNDANPCTTIFSDDFSSGLTQWNNTTDWTTTGGELKHDLSGIAGDSYINADIGIQNLAFGDYEWSFCLRNGNWDPSGGNNFAFVLLSNNSNLFTNPVGYRVGVNQSGTSDILTLYRVNNGTDFSVIDSTFNWDANDDVCIRVTRSNTGDWELFYNDGSGEVSAGTANDTTYTTGSFIGSYFQFSSSRAGLLWIDDVNVCSNPIACSSTVTWDGTSWSPTTPDASTHAVLNANYNTSTAGQPSFTSCSLTINSGFDLSITPNEYVEVFTDVTNNGRILIQDQGSFVQVDNAATYDDSGSTYFATNNAAVVDKNTSLLNEWYEYTYWSSPVANETFGNALWQSSQYRRFEFNAANYRDSEYETLNNNTLVAGAGVDDIDDDGNDWFLKAATDNLVPGVGYAATHSITAFLGANNYLYTFRGTLNNGDITVPVERNDLETGDTNWNLIGNPYPSAIDADLFFAKNNYLSDTANGRLDGAIYLWSQDTPPSNTTNGNEPLNFTNNDYAVINGTAETVGGDGITPTRHIPSGQGFFVTYSDTPTATTGTVTFTNAMRIKGNNDQFFRTTNNPSVNLDNKLWLNINTDNGLSNQTVIGYVPGATAANDGAYYDAKKNGVILASLSFYTVIPGDSKKLAIQGKSPNDLDINETIHLGFLNSIDVPTIYTISIDHLQGDFLSNNSIYLKDNLLNTYQDLTTSDYSFTSDLGEFNSRFEIVFTQPSLSIDDLALTEKSLSIIETENNNVTFKMSNSNLTIKTVKIFDALGRLIYDLKGNNSIETYNLSNLSQAAYIAKVELSNGQLINKKAIKK
ncbi:Calx-beta domain-containing protein [Olleya sp. R77988]|uniref:Calx-beta domain-containing protein n=1 Tax=Olleya sp. R77988 TaxID=3093875 RepID=UPI0037CB157A